MPQEFVTLSQGLATPADIASIQKDQKGFTHPNLHRRIDATAGRGEWAPKEYTLSIQGVDSYRTTKSNVHDEESTTSECP